MPVVALLRPLARWITPVPPPRALAVAAVPLALAATAGAAEWLQQEGPFGGTVLALDQDTSGAIYALRGDAVLRTTDGGATWTDVGPSSFTLLDLDVTPGGALWAGTSTRGVAWSLNGGATWTNDQIETNTHTGLGASIGAIGVDPQGRIFAGGYRSANQGASFTQMSIGGLVFAFDAAGQALAGTMDGVWQSANGGVSWTAINAGMAGERVEALAVDGASGIWAGTGDGEVWRSTDSGATWTLGGPGLPGAAVQALEVVAGGVLAAVRGGGLFRSTDGGASWSAAGADPGEVLDLHLDGADLWLATAGHGVFTSADLGVTAQSASAADMYVSGITDLAADAGGPLYLSSIASGIHRSTDGGATWHASSSGIGTLFVEDVAGGDVPGRAWAAAWLGLFATTDGGDTWTSAGFADQRMSEVMALPGGRLVAVTATTPVVHLSTDDGATWQPVFSSPFAFRLDASAVADDGTVLLGGQGVFGGELLRSTDAGATWTEMQVGFSGLEALATGPGGLAWAAAGENVVHRSTDRGATWIALPQGGWPTGTVGSLAALARAPEGLFLVGTGRVFLSTDEGDTWTEVPDGLPAGGFVSILSSTPAGLFAGTGSSGVFRFAAGATGATLVAGNATAAIRVAPNPFRDVTRVSWHLPRPASVRVLVHDVRGRRIADLFAGPQPAGPGALSWDGTAAGRPVAPGTYFLRWEADGRAAGAKVLRVR